MGETAKTHRLMCVFCLAVWHYWGFVKDARDERCPACQGKRRHPPSPRWERRLSYYAVIRLDRLVERDLYGKRGRRNRLKEKAA